MSVPNKFTSTISPLLFISLFLCTTAMEVTSKPHAALLSSPGMGHIIPVLELGKRLVHHHNFNVTIFIITTHSSSPDNQLPQSAIIPNILEIVEIPPPDISNLVGPDAAVVTRLAVIMRAAEPSVSRAIKSMKCPLSILIVDFFGTESLRIGEELNVPKYVYIPASAWFLTLTVYTPVLDKLVEGEYVDQKEPIGLPGCKPVRPEDVADPMLDRSNQQYHEYVRMGKAIPMCDGILVNSWEDLEPVTLGALRGDKNLNRVMNVPVHPIGPLIRSVGSAGGSAIKLLNWLDTQPKESVIYVSFGSGGNLSAEQIIELAWGLESSQQKFIWVVRPPTQNDADASFFSMKKSSDDNPSWYLPNGFLTRTHNVGVVVPNWAPQREILGHPSVGGFLSHCGWNSILESIVNGVPMIAWPLYAEQRMNATNLTEEFKIAVRPEVLPTKKVVGREEIEKMVREIMQENEMRERVKELKYSAEKILSKVGSSYTSLSQLAKACEIKSQNDQS